MHFGFKTHEGWLVNYGKTHGEAYGFPASTAHDLFNFDYAVSILQRQTGISQLNAELILLEAEDTSIPPPKEYEPEGTIVAVCSNLRDSFRNRPSQAQMDHLKQILGTKEEPKWWMAADPN